MLQSNYPFCSSTSHIVFFRTLLSPFMLFCHLDICCVLVLQCRPDDVMLFDWQINLTIYVSGFIKQLWERDGVSFEQLCQVDFLFFAEYTLHHLLHSNLSANRHYLSLYHCHLRWLMLEVLCGFCRLLQIQRKVRFNLP